MVENKVYPFNHCNTSNEIIKYQKVKSEVKTEFVSKLQTLRDKDVQTLFKLYDDFSNSIVFVPIRLRYEQQKVSKSPLVRWRNLSLEESKNWLGKLKAEESFGIAIKIEDFDCIVLDIDDVERFKNFVNTTDWIEDFKRDAFIINKSINRGYHIYIGSRHKGQFLKLLSLTNNHELLKSYGFEIRTQGLVVIPPSRCIYRDRVFESKFLYINANNLDKQIESECLQLILSLIEIYETRKALEAETKTVGEHKDKVIKEIKSRVKFRDLIGEKLHKRYQNYEVYHCPFHPPDEKPSFVVFFFPDYEIAKDYHENKNYDVIKFYQEYYGCKFIQALEELSKRAGIDSKITRQAQVIREETGAVEKYKGFFETERAFYANPHHLSGNKIRRYAVDKVKNEIWEVIEEIKLAVPKSKLEEDRSKASEIVLIEEDKVVNGKLYSYRIITYSNWISGFAVTGGEVTKDVLGFATTQYTLNLLTNFDKKAQIIIKDKTLEEAITILKSECLVAKGYKIKDALSQIINSMICAEKIRVVHEIPYMGFFFDENDEKRIVCSRLNLKEVDKERLKDALTFLNGVIERFYNVYTDKFATILKWFVIAPFSFVAKQKRNLVKGLYLCGPARTGKTKAAVLAAQIWGSFKKVEGEGQTGASIDTVPRLGASLSRSCFPIIVNEPKAVFSKEETKEAVKNALTSTIARERYVDALQTIKIPALSNICFTSNYYVPHDDAIRRRLAVVNFSLKERKNLKNERDFSEALKKAETKLPAIGEAIAKLVSRNDCGFENLILSVNEENQFEVSQEILKLLYKEAGMEVPHWVKLVYEDDCDLEIAENESRMSTILQIKEVLTKRALEIIGKNEAEKMSWEEKILKVLENNPPVFLIFKENKVFITTGILDVLKEAGIEIDSLKTLGEILGYECKKHSFKINKKVISIQTIVIPLEDFCELISLTT